MYAAGPDEKRIEANSVDSAGLALGPMGGPGVTFQDGCASGMQWVPP